MKKKGDELSIADLLNLPKIEFEIIPTGIKVLDYILGGGIMNKALTLVTGVTGSGKSQLMLQIAQQFQKHSYEVLYFDIELAITPSRLRNFGLSDINLVQYAYSIEEFDSEILDKLTAYLTNNPNKKLLIIIDSFTAMRSEKLLNTAVDDNMQPGLEAKYLTYLLTKLLKLWSKFPIAVIGSAHLKQNIVLPMQSTHGTLTDSGYRIPGGAALQYYTSQLLSLRKKATKSVGNFEIKYVDVKILKNRLAASDKVVTLIYSDQEGFYDLLTSLKFLVEEKKIIEQGGSYYIPGLHEKGLKLKTIIEKYNSDAEFKQKLDNFIEEQLQSIFKPQQEKSLLAQIADEEVLSS